MQSWIHMLGLVLPNYVHWCWKTTESKKETKGTVGTCSCQTGRFLYPGHWGDAERPDGVLQHMFPKRTAWTRSACGKPGAENATQEAVRKHKAIKAWILESLQGSGQPQVATSWLPLQPECAFLGARVSPAELVLLLPGYTLFWKASTHLLSVLDKSFLRNPWVRKDWHFPFSFYVSQ